MTINIDKDNKISVQLKADGKKIKTNLRLPAKEVTYLRYIMDSNFIPTTAHIKKDKKGYKVDVINEVGIHTGNISFTSENLSPEEVLELIETSVAM